MNWRMGDRGLLCRVSPFRHLRVNGYLLLTAAYRSLSRLSSAPSARASTLRSFLLDLFWYSSYLFSHRLAWRFLRSVFFLDSLRHTNSFVWRSLFLQVFDSITWCSFQCEVFNVLFSWWTVNYCLNLLDWLFNQSLHESIAWFIQSLVKNQLLYIDLYKRPRGLFYKPFIL